jgi:superfamily II DNA or RNA helicase
MELRPYQHRLVDLVNQSITAGHDPCVVLPTGGGKTVITSELAKQALARGEDVLIAAHRLEIIKQLLASLARHLGETPQLITAASTTPMQRITVAMVPTLTRRPRWIERMAGRTYILDECHHQVAPGYQRLRERLEPGKFIGMTATPITPTGGGLGRHFSDLVIGPDPAWLMEHGFLCRYKLYGAPAEIDTTGITVRAGEYALNELEERVTTVQGNVLRDWHRFNPDGKSTICVGISVEHAHALARLYGDAGVSAAAVDGTTPAAERDRIFADFRSGAITVLCACAVVDEGLDVPEATCLQLLRPTRSLRLYRQLIGRVLRPAEGKEEAIIIDHGGSWRHLPLPDEHIDWSLAEKVKNVKAEDRQVSRDDDDFVVAKRESIVEDNIHLRLVTTTASIEAKRQEVRRRLHKTIGLIQRGIIPERALYNFVKDARYFNDNELLAIQQTLNLPHNWVEDQVWLSGRPLQ